MIGKSPQWHWLAIDGDGTEYTLFRTGKTTEDLLFNEGFQCVVEGGTYRTAID